jgi:hypothetical protein
MKMTALIVKAPLSFDTTCRTMFELELENGGELFHLRVQRGQLAIPQCYTDKLAQLHIDCNVVVVAVAA